MFNHAATKQLFSSCICTGLCSPTQIIVCNGFQAYSAYLSLSLHLTQQCTEQKNQQLPHTPTTRLVISERAANMCGYTGASPPVKSKERDDAENVLE